MPPITVIIPIYGVEKYIERCARSLFEQTLDDIEYIFVDDCTPDTSIHILNRVLEEYPHRKSQVTIHHFPHNRGLCSAREWGIRHASGQYIAHCDSDDWVEKDMYRLMYETAIHESADIVVCDFYKAKPNTNKHKKGFDTTDKNQFLNKLIYKKYPWSVWNKIYKRSLYTPDFQYPSDSMGEDMSMVIQLVCRAATISYVPAALYYYNINPKSMVHSKTESTVLSAYNQHKNNVDAVLKTLETYTTALIPDGYKEFLLFLVSINMTPLAYHNNACLAKWRQCCPIMGKSFFLNTNIPFRYKFKYLKLCLYYIFKITL